MLIMPKGITTKVKVFADWAKLAKNHQKGESAKVL
jgi:hypothetical protein